MLRLITPVHGAIFTGIVGIAMVLTGRELGGSIVISAALLAFIFFEWYLAHRREAGPTESPEYQQMMFAASQWEKAIIEKEKQLDEREAMLNITQGKLRREGEKRAAVFDGEADIYCPPEFRDR